MTPGPTQTELVSAKRCALKNAVAAQVRLCADEFWLEPCVTIT